MVKKIKVEQLQPGMYIHDLNCGWLDHPFLKSSLKVTDEELIKKIGSHGICEVYIDTEKGIDIADAATKEEIKQEIQSRLKDIYVEEVVTDCHVPIKEELARAKAIRREAKDTVKGIMNDIRFGRNIERGKVEEVVDKMAVSIFRNQDAILSLAKIRKVDEYTYAHSVSTCALMLAFGKHLGFEAEELREAGIGAMLHDIGKVKVPLHIVNKRGPLTDDEIIQVREHVRFGCTLLEETPGISDISIMITAEHHERVDGRGYPNGLAGDDISRYGKVAAIIDVYDSMTSNRSYRNRIPATDALGKLFEWSKINFDDDLVQQFVRCIGIYPIGSLVYLENGLIAVVINHGLKSLLHPLIRVVFDTKRNSYVRPYDIDLAQDPDLSSEDRIMSYASPDQWNINPEIYF
jgi:HD-GYP domain-containing protein (c-di-GMP phosphodiesterase class II)